MEQVEQAFENFDLEDPSQPEFDDDTTDITELQFQNLYGSQHLTQKLRSSVDSRATINKKLSARLRSEHQTQSSVQPPSHIALLPSADDELRRFQLPSEGMSQYNAHSNVGYSTTSTISTVTEETCKHQRRTIDGTCVECGQWQKFENAQIVVKKKRQISNGIKKDIQSTCFDDEIKKKAEEIYAAIVTSGAKTKSRTRALFYCLFQAHQQLGIVIDPCYLACIVGLPPNLTSKAMNHYNYQQYGEGYRNVNSYIEPVELLRSYCRLLGLTSEGTESVVDFYNSIALKNKIIMDRSPRPTIAAIISYYLIIRGEPIDDKKMAEVFKLSPNTIKSTRRNISVIDNEEIAADSVLEGK